MAISSRSIYRSMKFRRSPPSCPWGRVLTGLQYLDGSQHIITANSGSINILYLLVDRDDLDRCLDFLLDGNSLL